MWHVAPRTQNRSADQAGIDPGCAWDFFAGGLEASPTESVSACGTDLGWGTRPNRRLPTNTMAVTDERATLAWASWSALSSRSRPSMALEPRR